MPAVSSAKELPHEFSANYALEMFGTVLARATYTLEHTEDGLTMTQSTRPAGLIAMLRNDKIDVRSDMIVDNGRVLLVNYSYTHTGDEKDRNIRFNIDWKANNKQELAGKATGIYEGKAVDIDLQNPVWDPLSIQVPIMLDANKKLPPHEHGLFMKGEFKHYLFENHGNETFRYNGTAFAAVKIVGRETKRDRAMYVWLLPELHNIPVKIEQWKNGEHKSTVFLESVSFEEDGRTRTLNLTDSPEDYE
ncbi:MAG: DUF3108 domain-containing protein [Thiotrichales bacterium]|nr:MAG: DUF3108 domain-containing protein [Thiotrichales bacterium]